MARAEAQTNSTMVAKQLRKESQKDRKNPLPPAVGVADKKEEAQPPVALKKEGAAGGRGRGGRAGGGTPSSRPAAGVHPACSGRPGCFGLPRRLVPRWCGAGRGAGRGVCGRAARGAGPSVPHVRHCPPPRRARAAARQLAGVERTWAAEAAVPWPGGRGNREWSPRRCPRVARLSAGSRGAAPGVRGSGRGLSGHRVPHESLEFCILALLLVC